MAIEKSEIKLRKFFLDVGAKEVYIELAQNIIEDGVVIQTLIKKRRASAKHSAEKFDQILDLIFPLVQGVNTKQFFLRRAKEAFEELAALNPPPIEPPTGGEIIEGGL